MEKARARRLFGDLKVRLKLIVLHNLFFLVLAGAVYLAVIPLFEEHVAQARAREVSLITRNFGEARPLLRLPGLEIYDYREGPAESLGISPALRVELDNEPGVIQRDPVHPDTLYVLDRDSGLYRRLRMPDQFYEDVLRRARTNLFLVLGLIYGLAVAALEWFVMPRYVYRPLRLMLAADEAARKGERERELIAERSIAGDEIGQIMRSRNATVAQLRRREAELEQVNQDLTRKNELLETAKRNIADQDRLVSLGMLSASVAHELNTPLAVLHGSIEKLIETVEGQASQERLARMLRVTERLRRMSASLVDFARVRRQQSEIVILSPLIEESWGLVAIDEKAGRVRFANQVPRDELVVGNADRLIQLFVNLLRNALLAVQSGGYIWVRREKVVQDGECWINILVEDDGPGIPADVLPNVFEAFVTSRLDARGTGLGLTVAEGIAHQHGGSISASNRPGGGARLEVRLPAAPAGAAATPSGNGRRHE